MHSIACRRCCKLTSKWVCHLTHSGLLCHQGMGYTAVSVLWHAYLYAAELHEHWLTAFLLQFLYDLYIDMQLHITVCSMHSCTSMHLCSFPAGNIATCTPVLCAAVVPYHAWYKTKTKKNRNKSHRIVPHHAAKCPWYHENLVTCGMVSVEAWGFLPQPLLVDANVWHNAGLRMPRRKLLAVIPACAPPPPTCIVWSV